MGKKMLYGALIIGCTVVAYVVMLAIQPAFNTIVSTANASMWATSNMSNYFGTVEVVNSSPFWIWLVPGGIGIISLVVLFRSGERQ